MSDEFKEMRINKCKYRNTSHCPYYERKEMKETYWEWQNLAVEEIDYKGAKYSEALQKANELYCNKCDKYTPMPTHSGKE